MRPRYVWLGFAVVLVCTSVPWLISHVGEPAAKTATRPADGASFCDHRGDLMNGTSVIVLAFRRGAGTITEEDVVQAMRPSGVMTQSYTDSQAHGRLGGGQEEFLADWARYFADNRIPMNTAVAATNEVLASCSSGIPFSTH